MTDRQGDDASDSSTKSSPAKVHMQKLLRRKKQRGPLKRKSRKIPHFGNYKRIKASDKMSAHYERMIAKCLVYRKRLLKENEQLTQKIRDLKRKMEKLITEHPEVLHHLCMTCKNSVAKLQSSATEDSIIDMLIEAHQKVQR